MHAKAVVADGEVLTGSYNCSHGGEENAENVLWIQDAAAADQVARVHRPDGRAVRGGGRRRLS